MQIGHVSLKNILLAHLFFSGLGEERDHVHFHILTCIVAPHRMALCCLYTKDYTLQRTDYSALLYFQGLVSKPQTDSDSCNMQTFCLRSCISLHI